MSATPHSVNIDCDIAFLFVGVGRHVLLCNQDLSSGSTARASAANDREGPREEIYQGEGYEDDYDSIHRRLGRVVLPVDHAVQCIVFVCLVSILIRPLAITDTSVGVDDRPDDIHYRVQPGEYNLLRTQGNGRQHVGVDENERTGYCVTEDVVKVDGTHARLVIKRPVEEDDDDVCGHGDGVNRPGEPNELARNFGRSRRLVKEPHSILTVFGAHRRYVQRRHEDEIQHRDCQRPVRQEIYPTDLPVEGVPSHGYRVNHAGKAQTEQGDAHSERRPHAVAQRRGERALDVERPTALFFEGEEGVGAPELRPEAAATSRRRGGILLLLVIHNFITAFLKGSCCRGVFVLWHSAERLSVRPGWSYRTSKPSSLIPTLKYTCYSYYQFRN